MELITKKIAVITFLLTLFSLAGISQSFEKQVAAFQQSYINEASGDFTKAIENLKAVYIG